LIFFQISGIFSTCFGCFLPANTTNKKSLNYKGFTKPFSAIYEVSRPVAFETETPKNGSRDRDQVLRLHYCWRCQPASKDINYYHFHICSTQSTINCSERKVWHEKTAEKINESTVVKADILLADGTIRRNIHGYV